MTQNATKVLLIDDDPGNVSLVQQLLQGATGFEFDSARNLTAGARRLAEESFDVLLLDIGLPEGQGLEAFSRAYANAPHVPIVVLTGPDDERTAIETLNRGAQDYLVKEEITGNLLTRSIRYAIGRKQAQEQMLIKDQAVASSISGIAITDLRGTITYVNQAFLNMWGYDNANEVLGKEAIEFWGSEEKAQEALQGVQETGSWAGELEAVRENGSTFAAQLLANLVRDEGGQAVGIMASFVDITERKRTQESLRRSEAEYYSLVESLNEVIYCADPETYAPTYVNSAAERVFGYTTEEWLNAPELWEKSIHPDDRERVFANLEKAQAKMEPCTHEYRITRKDGAEAWVREHVTWKKDEQGKLVSVNGILYDITESKQMQEALRESEEKFRQIFNNANDAMYLHGVTEEGMPDQLFEVNDTACEMLGYSREEFLTMSPLDIDAEETVERVPGIMEEIWSKGHVAFEMHHKAKDGTRIPVEISSQLFDLGDKKMILSVARDISERKRAEKALNERVKELTCLFAITRDMQENLSVDEVCQRAVEHLVPAMHFPDVTVPVIQLDDRQFGSDRHIEELSHGLHAEIKVEGETRGQVRVHYSEERPFLIPEEQNLVNGVAEMLGLWLERKQAEQQIRDSLEEKKTLLAEIHHRVKNNLQVVSSLLRRQGRQIQDETLKQMLKESENRVLSMSLIHEKLYRSESLAAINFKEFSRSLSQGLLKSYGIANVALKTDIEDIQIPIDSAIPCGLIVNELVSNALKYAFPEGQGGQIEIGLHRMEDGEVELMVRDNGVGMPEDIDIRNTESLGMHLVTILGENQLGGNIDLDRGEGTEFRIRFSLP